MLFSDFLVTSFSHQMLQRDTWLRPSPVHTTHWNELPDVDHTPGHAHAHHNMLLWEAPDAFLGNKVSSSRSEGK